MVAPKFSPALGFLRKLVVLPPVDTKGFQLFGLRLDPWHRRLSSLVTLGDPLAGGSMAMRVMELHQEPRSVWVMNEGDRRIFLPAGETLPGIRGRRLRVSLVVGARETLKLRQDLLETGPDLTAEEGPYSPPPPPGSSYSAQTMFHRHATGAVLARGGRILCLHLFDGNETLRRLLPGIFRSCSVAPFPEHGNWSNLNVGEVEAWIEQVSSLRAQVRAALGLGREVFIEEERLRGRCLLLDECPVHAVIAIAEPPPAVAADGTPQEIDGEDDLPEAIPPASRRRDSSGGSHSPGVAGPPADAPSPGGMPD